ALREHIGNVDIDALANDVVHRDDEHDSPLGARPLDVFNPATYVDRVRASGAAVLSIGGWLDGPYPHAAIKRHLTLDSAESRLLVGPWNDGVAWQSSPHARDRRVAFDLSGELLRFFDEHLKGIDTGLSREPRVRWFTMGKERWRQGGEWPPKDVVIQR